MDFIDTHWSYVDSLASEEARGKRPFKVWDCGRDVRKALVVGSFDELLVRGREKLNLDTGENIRIVLEADGTQVEDGDYFRTLPDNTVFLFLRQGERWYPAGVDVIRAAISSIPKIVCETIYSLELQDEAPSWKIMDNRGRITVVLNWDQRPQTHKPTASKITPKPVGVSKTSPLTGALVERTTIADVKPSIVVQTSFEGYGIQSTVTRDGKKETLINDVYPPITVINHDESYTPKAVSSYGTSNIQAGSGPARLSRQGSSIESTTIHIHTPECANHIHQPRGGSPNDNNQCDFHCCALHEEGRKIQVHKSVATSPIQDAQQDGKKPMTKGAHVRFLDIERDGSGAAGQKGENESSESETETNANEEDAVTSEKFLLLTDQLSMDQKHHLTIRDIGVILDRLSSKIVDVEKLDRETESEDCYNWTIKATIRGDVLRELGVIYNGNYYAICEHPGYKEDIEEGTAVGEEEPE